ncbi:MAG TPA: bifunctional precorrin-2 dehydrogenase/sirohydrochlorin ferrochelatase [Methylomirabilota bacterium]|jgi:siroheme synthase-like protein|nr:bifunctional precorrin-2 dehydrogenase/sirohydrochlorin ferrochelatase [Methylomirabilota bacterium]
MGYYPIFVDMRERPALVVGGGDVAERKVDALLRVEARVTVVSPTLTARLAAWVRQGRIRHLGRTYRARDIRGHQFAFVATDDGAANAAVARDGRQRGVWVNAADDPAHCDFILPSVLRRGDLTVAVATGGTSPALARAVREELEAYLTDDYATLAEIVGEVRRELRARERSPDAETWNRALGPDLRALVAAGRPEAAKRRLLERLGAA